MEAHNNNSGMKTRGSREGAKGDKNLFLSVAKSSRSQASLGLVLAGKAIGL